MNNDRGYYIDLFSNICKKNDIKVTPQRLAIYKIIIKSKLHPTADIVYKEVIKDIPHITFDTVNRTLKTFTHIGLIDYLPSIDSSRHYDPNLEPHHHCQCIYCKKIIDLEDNRNINFTIPEQLPDGFEGLHGTLLIKGICRKCK